jgi:hypothetical protein
MSHAVLVSQPNLRIERRTGSEGPRHDPYHYDEWTIRRDGFRGIVYHDGLSEWIRYSNGKIFTIREGDHELAEIAFRRCTGYTMPEWTRAIALLERSRSRRHRNHDVREESGYPGEHFTFCHTCDVVIDSYFNEGAVI